MRMPLYLLGLIRPYSSKKIKSQVKGNLRQGGLSYYVIIVKDWHIVLTSAKRSMTMLIELQIKEEKATL